MIGARASFALILAFVAGCGSGTQSTKQLAREMCTGVEQLQLAALTLPPPSRSPPGMQVTWDNGSRFVYVDGTCRYWALANLVRWAEVRTGVLTPTEAQALVSRLRYESWSSWAGEFHPASGVFDADLVILSEEMRSSATVLCFGGCIGAPVPPELQGVAGGFADLQIPIKDAQGARYKLFLRDAVPYEDEAGLIRPH